MNNFFILLYHTRGEFWVQGSVYTCPGLPARSFDKLRTGRMIGLNFEGCLLLSLSKYPPDKGLYMEFILMIHTGLKAASSFSASSGHGQS